MGKGSNSLLQKRPNKLWGPPTTIQWVQLALSSKIKRPGCEVNHSPPSSIKVKNYRSHISGPPKCFHGVCQEKRVWCPSGLVVLGIHAHISTLSHQLRLHIPSSPKLILTTYTLTHRVPPFLQ